MSYTADQPIDLTKYLRMFWRRRALVFLCMVTIACAAAVGLEFVPAEYEAHATLTIEERQRLADGLEKLMGGLSQRAGGRRIDEERIAKIESRVKSRPFLERVVKLLRLNEDPVLLEHATLAAKFKPGMSVEEIATRSAVGDLRGKLSFATKGTGVYEITVTDHSPKNAQILAKWISELYIDVTVQNSIDELRRAHDFGAEQLKIYEEQLRRSEAALETYRSGQIAQTLGQSIVTGRNVGFAEALYKRVLDEADVARLRVLPFERAVSEARASGAEDEILDDTQIKGLAHGLSTTLNDAISNRLVTDTPLLEDWPPSGNYVTLRRGLFQAIERRTRDTSDQGDDELNDSIARLAFAKLDYEAHSLSAEFLGTAISDFRQQVQSGPRSEIELGRLEAVVSTDRELLGSFRSQLVASDVSQAVESTNLGPRIEILDPPQVPYIPSAPNRLMILIAALGLGPILGLGLALVAELFDTTMHSLSDFRRVFQGPILGATPLLSSRATQVRRLRLYWTPAALIGVLVLTTFFFLTKSTLLSDVVSTGETVRAIDPEETATP